MLGRKSCSFVLMFVLLSCVFFDQTYRICAVSVYEVVDPQFPPDLFGDINKDGKVNMPDLSLLARALGTTSASGGTPPAWGAWNPACDIVLDNRINGLDLAYVSTRYGAEDSPPVAYSTDFEFVVPNDGDSEVHYYVYARFYVPYALHEQKLYFNASDVDEWVLSVKIDKGLVYSGSTGDSPYQPMFVELGNLQFGYHLLEFEFVEKSASGNLHFDITTASGEEAWLSRFRVCVPDYGDNEYRYTVKTRTYFPGDDFFLGGFADDFIDDIMVDVGLVWQDWMWDMGSVYGAIYAWGDGFMYPLGREDGWHDMSFTFGEIWGSGLLDFQYISWTNQREKLGKPRFCASTKITDLGSHIGLGEGKIYGGSRWDQPDKPEISERTYEIRTRYNNISYADQNYWFVTSLEVGIGNWWTEWGLTKGSHDDVGIPLNLTLVEFFSNRHTGRFGNAWYYWGIYLKNYTIDAYSFPALRITGMENDVGDSKGKITPDYTIAADFGGTVLMSVSSLMDQPIGIAVGLGIKGMAAGLKYVQGQVVSRYDKMLQENNHWQLKSTRNLGVYPPIGSLSGCESSSDLVFLGLDPAGGKACGLTKIVLKGTLEASYSIVPDSTRPFCFLYPIGNIEITLHIPWFVWP